MDTKIVGKVETKLYPIAAATVIEAGDLVTKSSGLIIKATATSGTVARAMVAHAASGGTTIECSYGRVRLKMDASDVYAVAHRGVEYDIAIDGDGKATINQSGTTYKVLIMDLKQPDSLSVGDTSGVHVIINRPIDDVTHPTS